MGDKGMFDPKVSSPDCLLSSMKFGAWCRLDHYKDRSFDGCDDYLDLDLDLDLEWKDDVINMLPSDPFEMNKSRGRTMIRGWFDEDIGYIKISEDSVGDEISLDDTDGLFLFDEKSKKVLHSVNEHKANCCHGDDDGDIGTPHDALCFALAYLGMKDLLSVERVCKSLRDCVRNDPLLWRNIQIDQTPGKSFTDDSLLRITNRAGGSLQSLSLFKCSKITDNGLKNVFQQNLGLTKLSVVGCNGLSMEGLLNNMKNLKSASGVGISRLRISLLQGITMEQYEELRKVLLSMDNKQKHHTASPKPRFYHGGQLYLSLDDDHPIDIEVCPKCHQLRHVYDCPAKSCEHCRACAFCIPRCISCGYCFKERNYTETFCLDFICLDCLTQYLSFPDGEEEDISISGFHQQASYHFCLYG